MVVKSRLGYKAECCERNKDRKRMETEVATDNQGYKTQYLVGGKDG